MRLTAVLYHPEWRLAVALSGLELSLAAVLSHTERRLPTLKKALP
jgi:hypothetical protein